MTAAVRIIVPTYRRPALLQRALVSVQAQTCRDWRVEVANDDPDDRRVADLVSRLADPRIQLLAPCRHRGGTGNFNLAFTAAPEPFTSILEDDNWWEPWFLDHLLSALARHPAVAVACGNERIWVEQLDGTWRNTGRTIWPVDAPDRLFKYRPLDKCGAAKLCNSSLLFRTAEAAAWQTPGSIPIDVTEHYRERAVPHPILLVAAPLVNHAETLTTSRSRDPSIWAAQQLLLVGSVFALCPETSRAALAAALWRRARTSEPYFGAALISTGVFVPEARPLWQQSWVRERLRFAVSAVRRPALIGSLAGVRRHRAAEWNWLTSGSRAHSLQQSFADETLCT